MELVVCCFLLSLPPPPIFPVSLDMIHRLLHFLQRNNRAALQQESPTTNTLVCKIGAQSEYVHVAYTFYAHLAPDLYAQSVVSNKISASELSRKFIKSALLVGRKKKKRKLRRKNFFFAINSGYFVHPSSSFSFQISLPLSPQLSSRFYDETFRVEG